MSSGEDFLVERDLLGKPTDVKQRILGCMACLWGKRSDSGEEPVFYANQITRCSGLQSGTVTPILHRLEKGGVVASTFEVVGQGDRMGTSVRRNYRPADSALGVAFADSLEVSAPCNLPEQPSTPSNDDLERAALVTQIIDTSSPG